MTEFKKRKVFLQKTQTRFESRLDRIRSLRVALSIGFIIGLIYLTSNPQLRFEAVLIVAFLCVFIPLVFRSRNLEAFLRKLVELQKFYDREEARALGRIGTLKTRKAFADRSEWPAAARDLQLWGDASLFTYLDETVTTEGSDKLSDELVTQDMNLEKILKRQKQISLLSPISGKIRHIVVEGRVLERTPETKKLIEYCQSNSMPQSILLGMMALCTFWLVLLLWTIVAGETQKTNLGIAWFLFVAISLSLTQFSSRVFQSTLHLTHALAGFQNLLRRFEDLASNAVAQGFWPLLAKKSMSKELKKIDRWASFLSVEAHPIIYLALNALTPWSAFFGILLEFERKKIAKTSGLTFEELHELEIVCSLTLSHRYRTQEFAQFSPPDSNALHFVASEAIHPLIHRPVAIANSFSFNSEKRLCLITGSNMSGKSTFLRTLGVNQTMALMGAPVFAKKWQTVLAGLETCIQVSDSLNDGFSYFYSEVLRLKTVLENCKQRKSFYLIDEIFKGTNNRERLIGSEALLTALSKTFSFGFVTTHDLELTSLEQKFPMVCNFHFRDEFHGGKMTFPYKIFAGPCTTTNALKIMAQEGLPVPV